MNGKRENKTKWEKLRGQKNGPCTEVRTQTEKGKNGHNDHSGLQNLIDPIDICDPIIRDA